MQSDTPQALAKLVDDLELRLKAVELDLNAIPFKQKFDNNTLLDRASATVSFRRDKDGWGLFYIHAPEAPATRLQSAPVRVRLTFYKKRAEFIAGYLDHLEELRQELEAALADASQGEET